MPLNFPNNPTANVTTYTSGNTTWLWTGLAWEAQPASITATTVGLENVTNESKATMFANPTFTGTVSGITAAMVGLGNVTNESKATMFANPTFTGTVSGVTAAHVGLGNATNESKATMFASPTFTGTVSGVTAAHVGLGNVTNESKATMFANPTFTGTVSGVSATHVGLGNVSNDAQLKIASNLSDLNNTATARTNLGATTVGASIFTVANPSAVSFIRINADNTITTRSNSDMRTDLGATTVGSNIFTVANPSAVRFVKINADNTVTLRSDADFKTDLSLNNVTNESKATMFTGSTLTGSTQINSLGVGTAASGTAGEIRATNEITAYYTSDITLKENIEPIGMALEKIEKITGVMFDWKEEYIERRGGVDGFFVRRRDTGIIAQDVESVLPEIVGVRPDGTKGVKYEKLAGLIIEAIKELHEQVKDLRKNKP